MRTEESMAMQKEESLAKQEGKEDAMLRREVNMKTAVRLGYAFGAGSAPTMAMPIYYNCVARDVPHLIANSAIALLGIGLCAAARSGQSTLARYREERLQQYSAE